jgi:hypothetical protein
MATLPPSGFAPTLPPPPAGLALRAQLCATFGVAALWLALWWSMNATADATLFAYGDDVVVATLGRRLLYGASGAAMIAAWFDAVRAGRRVAGAVAIVALLGIAWVATLVCALIV